MESRYGISCVAANKGLIVSWFDDLMATPKRTVFFFFWRASATVLQADPETIDTEALEASNQKKDIFFPLEFAVDYPLLVE